MESADEHTVTLPLTPPCPLRCVRAPASGFPPSPSLCCVSRESRRLAFLSVGLGSLGLLCLLVGLVGTYAPTKTVLKQEIHFLRSPPSMAGWEDRGRNQVLAMAKRGPERRETMLVMPPPPEHYVAPVPKAQKLKAGPKTQQLKLTFKGETPLGDDDFDAAGYNMV